MVITWQRAVRKIKAQPHASFMTKNKFVTVPYIRGGIFCSGQGPSTAPRQEPGRMTLPLRCDVFAIVMYVPSWQQAGAPLGGGLHRRCRDEWELSERKNNIIIQWICRTAALVWSIILWGLFLTLLLLRGNPFWRKHGVIMRASLQIGFCTWFSRQTTFLMIPARGGAVSFEVMGNNVRLNQIEAPTLLTLSWRKEIY